MVEDPRTIVDPSARAFAILPAAGVSRRMGADKLLLPLDGRTVIEHVLTVWLASRVDHVVLVVRPEDRRLAEIGQRLGAEVVVPRTAPAEMKESVTLGLTHVAQTYRPGPAEPWLVAPADMPRLQTAAIDQLLAAYRPHDPKTLVAARGGRKGHPVLLPWERVAEVHALPPGQGMNAVIEAQPFAEVEVDSGGIHEDLDTPEDYRRLQGDWNSGANRPRIN